MTQSEKPFRPSIFWLFIFAPVAIILEKIHAGESLIFYTAETSVIPITKLICESTEHLALHTGDSIGGLLNATFDNAPELILIREAS